MERYIIQRNNGIIEFYAGPKDQIAIKFTSNAHFATRWTYKYIAETFAARLQRVYRDGLYTVRKIIIA